MLLLLNVIEMIVLHKTSLLWVLMIIPSYFHSYPNKKKLKSTLIEKNSEDYLSNKKYQLYLLFEL
jgi:hypothetical protein